MRFWRELRAAVAFLLATSLACSPARALVALNDGHDRIYVTGSASVTHDTNVFTNSDNKGDFIYSSSISAEYMRRAGWIGVNGSVGVSSSKFAKFTGQSFANPSFSLGFTKQSGRTTGALSLTAARESRADAAVNLRTVLWNYGTNLSVKYPLAGAYTLSGQLGWASNRYIDQSLFANLSTYTAALDVYRILASDREVLAGYRYRYGETSRSTGSADHSLSLGLSGKIIRGVTGNLRLGYETRVATGQPAKPGLGGKDSPRFSSWTASGATSYAATKRLNFSAQIAKDISTTATDSSVDSLTASLDGQYAFSSRISLGGSAGWGDSHFLGESGRVVISAGPPAVLGAHRRDTFMNWGASFNYSLSEHLHASLGYVWFQNWSTSSYADFVRGTWSGSVSSHW
jgi:hypothetical protein